MKDDAVIKDNEAVYLLNEQTYLHLRENLSTEHTYIQPIFAEK